MKFVELKYTEILAVLEMSLSQTTQIQNKILYRILKYYFTFIKIKPLRTASMSLKLDLSQ